jgi:hypothetical protein
MTARTPPQAAADQGLDRVDRGQRVAREAHLTDGHDGKERARFVRPKTGELPADMAGAGAAAPRTVEDAVEAPPSASSWEAREEDDED